MGKRHIPESELVVNQDGSIYHLRLKPEQVADTILLVGDQNRVGRISKYFDSIEHEVQFREFVTHTGYVGEKRISVLSTGIGTDNIDIVLNELDTLFNVDLQSREIKENPVSLNLIRVGTSGTFQSDIPVGSLVLSKAAVGLDALMGFYIYEKNAVQEEFLHAFSKHMGTEFPINPYFFEAHQDLFEQLLTDDFIPGITATCAVLLRPSGKSLESSDCSAGPYPQIGLL
ncbi:MAG: phosphorylase [Saprospiraceae bacterium]